MHLAHLVRLGASLTPLSAFQVYSRPVSHWSQDAKGRHDRTSPPQAQCSPLTAEQPQMHRVRGRLAPPRPPSRPRASVKVPTLPWVSCLAVRRFTAAVSDQDLALLPPQALTAVATLPLSLT